MARKIDIIDNYFRQKDFYPWVLYRPIGETVVSEVERMGSGGLYLSTACALVEKESGGKNIFGCDFGSAYTERPPFCQVQVTKDRVEALIRDYYRPPVGGANGVGTTQITAIGYVEEAQDMGGAHLPKYQMRVGFRVLNQHIANLGWQAGASAYNAGAGNWRAVYATYGATMVRLEREWAARLGKAAA